MASPTLTWKNVRVPPIFGYFVIWGGNVGITKHELETPFPKLICKLCMFSCYSSKPENTGSPKNHPKKTAGRAGPWRSVAKLGAFAALVLRFCFLTFAMAPWASGPSSSQMPVMRARADACVSCGFNRTSQKGVSQRGLKSKAKTQVGCDELCS